MPQIAPDVRCATRDPQKGCALCGQPASGAVQYGKATLHHCEQHESDARQTVVEIAYMATGQGAEVN